MGLVDASLMSGFLSLLPKSAIFATILELDTFRLCVHDWGAAALAWAANRAAGVERLAIIDAVPLLPGYRWHRIARAWRTRGLGEIAVGLTIKPVRGAS